MLSFISPVYRSLCLKNDSCNLYVYVWEHIESTCRSQRKGLNIKMCLMMNVHMSPWIHKHCCCNKWRVTFIEVLGLLLDFFDVWLYCSVTFHCALPPCEHTYILLLSYIISAGNIVSYMCLISCSPAANHGCITFALFLPSISSYLSMCISIFSLSRTSLDLA